jgi:hypothetical protein
MDEARDNVGEVPSKRSSEGGGDTQLRRSMSSASAVRRPSAVKGVMRTRTTSRVTARIDQAYLKIRTLRRHASTLHLWGFTVGVVICGEFSGWQVQIDFGGV